MKTCSVCHERVSQDEGNVNDAGKFVCFPCAEEADDLTGSERVCPECGESSEALKEEGICPDCGYEAEAEASEDEGDSV